MRKLLQLGLATACAVAMTSVASAVTFVEVNDNLTSVNNATQLGFGLNATTGDYRWTKDKVYILTEVVHVLPPARLIIEPGTIVRGVTTTQTFETGTETEPGTLVICRGAKIIANGTPDDPIFFTSLGDPYVPGGTATIPGTVNGASTAAYLAAVNYSPDGPTGNNFFSRAGDWGGVILLGESPIGYDADDQDSGGSNGILQYDSVSNTYSGAQIEYPTGDAPQGGANDIKGGNGVGVANIEGLSFSSTITVTSYTDPFSTALNAPAAGQVYGGIYGGLDPDDNSGVMRFCSHRFGGFPLGPANEINGFTFGAIGRGTVAEWMESHGNKDDGFEWFGGFVSSKFLFSLYQGDDGFDGDQGFNGNFQFVFNITDPVTDARVGFLNGATGRLNGDRGDTSAEWDGAEDQLKVPLPTPNTRPSFYNWTFIHDASRGAGDGQNDAIRMRRQVTSLWGLGVLEDVFDDGYRKDADAGADNVGLQTVFFGVGDRDPGAIVSAPNEIVGAASQLRGAAHTTKFGLDPRLATASEASNLASFNIPAARVSPDLYPFSGFVPVSFAGAMRDNNMLKGWSVLDYAEVLGTTNVDRPAITMTVNGSSQAEVAWTADTDEPHTVVYLVEYSTDKRLWTTLAVVQDNVSSLNAAAIATEGYPVLSSDVDATAGTVKVTDTINGALVAGTPVYYRVTPL